MILTWQFFTKVLQVILIDTVLSGDNAVVIALAAHRLPRAQRRLAILSGAGGAIALRILFTFILTQLLNVPLMLFVGGVILVWISMKLLFQEEQEQKIREAGSLRQAIQTIIVADLVMSLDNMLAIAGASGGDLVLIIVGLLVSIAFIMTCSSLIADLMDRFPILVVAGAAILAWTAGDMILKDPTSAKFLIDRTQVCLAGKLHEHFANWFGADVPDLDHRHWIGWTFLVGITLFVITSPYWLKAVKAWRSPSAPVRSIRPELGNPAPAGTGDSSESGEASSERHNHESQP